MIFDRKQEREKRYPIIVIQTTAIKLDRDSHSTDRNCVTLVSVITCTCTLQLHYIIQGCRSVALRSAPPTPMCGLNVGQFGKT